MLQLRWGNKLVQKRESGGGGAERNTGKIRIRIRYSAKC